MNIKLAQQLAEKLRQTAKENEPFITQDIEQIALLASVKVVGLENRFKSEDSLIRKLQDFSATTQLPMKIVAKLNNDTLRYTYILLEDMYLQGFERIKEEFSKRDYRIGKVFDA